MIRVRSRFTSVAALALLAGLCGAALAQLGEPAVVKRAAELRDTPSESGRSLATLPAQEPVTRLPERRGAWVQVQTPPTTQE